jgi:hypothetical protein
MSAIDIAKTVTLDPVCDTSISKRSSRLPDRGRRNRIFPGTGADLPDGSAALDQPDQCIEGNGHRQHQKNAGKDMRAVENGPVSGNQVADPRRRDQHLGHHDADDDQRAADSQS